MKLALFAMFVGTALLSTAQSTGELYKLGMKYKKEVNNVKMLQVFKKIYKQDSTNAEYLGELSFAYSKVGANLSDEALQMKYYKKAKSVAKKAQKANPKSSIAQYSYALALARENENAKTKVKIANAKEIKKVADLVIKLNPKEAGAYHILGRWHATFAGFNNMENAMVNTFFGGKPEGGTYKDALVNFQKAIELEPWYMLHVYELAQTYYDMGEKDSAKKYVEKAMKLPQNYEDAKLCYKKCEKLLEKLK